MSNNNILSLKNDAVYGPVNSRRLGKSLGINVFAANTKVCTLDCLYCQYGFTRIKAEALAHQANYFSIEKIATALEFSLKNNQVKPDYLTFSGNGEATLHPEFPDLVAAVTDLRNKHLPASRTAVLSNGTQISRREVREALEKLDLQIIKLDCAGDKLFRKYNRPLIPIDLQQLISLLAGMKNITIQALFSGGPSGNYSPQHIKKWIKAVKVIRPVKVQLYSLDRGYPSRHITRLGSADLQPAIAELLQAGIPAQWY